MQTEDSIIHLSGEDIIELIRENRNDLIDKLLNDHSLRNFLSKNHGIDEISEVKLTFIKRALRELGLTSVELSHYGSLILDIRKSGAMNISKVSESLFYEDIENSIKNYL